MDLTVPPAGHGTRQLRALRRAIRHDTVRLLNAGEADAQLELMVFYMNCEPRGPLRITVPAHGSAEIRIAGDT